MNTHANVMTRVLTREFYRANAMFFLVVIAFCFGFMRGTEHLALAGYFVSSPWLVMIPIGVWIIYTMKVVLYNNREVRQERNVFLNSAPLLPFYVRGYAYTTVSVGQLAPVIAYGFFLVSVATTHRQLVPIVMIVGSLIVLIAITEWYLHHALVHPEKDKTTATPVRWLDKRTTKSMAWMFIEGIVRLQPGMIYMTKITTCLVIYAATHLYLYEDYDARLYWMAACAAFGANLALVYQFQRFEVVSLLLLRTLPLKLLTRVGTLILVMVVLCFPEIAMLATNLPAVLSSWNYIGAIVFGFSLIILGYGILYVRDVPFESFTRAIFFITMGWTLAILFKIPVLAGAQLNIAIGAYLLNKYFYSFELNS
ncbi:MAG TPA: hypothetical protein VFE50_01515 [Cyclobacteriaceae bacterium]|nr:hypothetical protein [Cyclobacteriaceae bacterium]